MDIRMITNQLLGILQTHRPPLEHQGDVGHLAFLPQPPLASPWALMLKWTSCKLFRTGSRIMTRLLPRGKNYDNHATHSDFKS